MAVRITLPWEATQGGSTVGVEWAPLPIVAVIFFVGMVITVLARRRGPRTTRGASRPPERGSR